MSDDLLERYEPDPQELQEAADRELERADSPLVWLDLCPLCGQDWCACWLIQPPC